jgi:hypothetical protein
MHTAEYWRRAASPVASAFNLFQQCSDVVIEDPSSRPTHCSGLDLKGLPLLHRSALGEGHSKSFVYDRFE